MCGFCNVWVCVCVGFVMCGFCNVWVCVCVGFVMCGLYNMWVFFLICVLVFTVILYCFMYIYSYLFCLYKFHDYCHRVRTQLWLKTIIIIIIIILSSVRDPHFGP
jgi:hypothetical protein